MSSLTLNTHKAIKALTESGITEEQAEKIVEVVADLQNSGAATKEDVRLAAESIKSDIGTVKNDIEWIKKLLLAMGGAVVIAALKYIFIG